MYTHTRTHTHTYAHVGECRAGEDGKTGEGEGAADTGPAAPKGQVREGEQGLFFNFILKLRTVEPLLKDASEIWMPF